MRHPPWADAVRRGWYACMQEGQPHTGACQPTSALLLLVPCPAVPGPVLILRIIIGSY